MVNHAEWAEIRRGLRFGQRLRGTVTAVPRPGAIGVFVDVGLPVGGFVDVLLLPLDAERWPREGDEVEFEVWWADERPQLRLKPADPRLLSEDFPRRQAEHRPHWPEPGTVEQALRAESEATGPVRTHAAAEEDRFAGRGPGPGPDDRT
ncbi:hypothetical protein [Kitasatospora sp. NPDC057198]|uniref:hypothetical protein n=1 Tax=Kitasatospora sp. NPDC057198 TaxID=3346046 RepID=UPI003626F367